MKKIIILFLGLMILSSCTQTVYVDKETGKRIYEPKTVLINGYPDMVDLVEITVDNETHEYLRFPTYHNSYIHWEGCKYCKKHHNE